MELERRWRLQRRRHAVLAKRIVRFVSAFFTARDPINVSQSDTFLEDFLRFLLPAWKSGNRTSRFRACPLVFKIILDLPDDAEVSSDLWDEVIDCMKSRLGDNLPIIHIIVVRTLSCFASDCENSDILDLFLEMLSVEQIVVWKTIVLSLPPSNATAQAFVDCTLDISEAVQKAAYCVLASKFPLHSLRGKHDSRKHDHPIKAFRCQCGSNFCCDFKHL